MLSSLFTSPFSFLLYTAALLIAITVHEFAHAWAADRLGDPTAKLEGRLTLNPLAHLDPIGTLMLLVFRFGWGKPVPIDPFNLRNPRRDAAIISVAGAVSNILTATVFSIIIRVGYSFLSLDSASLLESILVPIIMLNVLLGVFNLLPIHPLDGGKVIVGLLPEGTAQEVDAFLNQYGLIVLLALLFLPLNGPSFISLIISPIINSVLAILLPGGAFF